MNSIYFSNFLFKTNKYVHVYGGQLRLGFDGKADPRQLVKAIYETESDLAHDLFARGFYKNDSFKRNQLQPETLLTPHGGKMKEDKISILIEEHFPEETRKIRKKIELCNMPGAKLLMNLGLMDHWMTTRQKMIDNLPPEKLAVIKKVQEKSEHYIQTLFVDSLAKRLQEREDFKQSIRGKAEGKTLNIY